MNDTYKVSASCALGLEKVLANELGHLGLLPTEKQPGRVFFDAGKTGIAKALVWLRTADRLFIELARFDARNFDDLFDAAAAIPWERWIARDDALVIEKAKCLHSQLAAQNAVQAVTHKAAYTRLCSVYKTARMSETGNGINARVRIERDVAVIELDICGQPLSKRGYRKYAGQAPLKETIAAALLFLTGWKRSVPLFDPFCGAGTLCIEAALYACNRAPGAARHFAWEAMPDGGAAEIALAQEQARSAAEPERDVYIIGSDKDESAIRGAAANAARADVAPKIRFVTASAETTGIDLPPSGCVISDPPYGKRLGSPDEIDALYAALPRFARRLDSWSMNFIVDRERFDLGKSAHSKKTKITDGAEIRYFHRFGI